MNKKYLIKKVFNCNDNIIDDLFWNAAEILEISNWPWHTSELPKPPKVRVNLLYSNSHLFLKYTVHENYIQAQHLDLQDSVCQDSCVEFFVSTDNKKYFNFEINCIGTLLLGYRKNRHDKTQIEEQDLADIEIFTSLPKRVKIYPAVKCPQEGYCVIYSIPFTLFEKYAGTPAPASGTAWKANFYKCGDLTPEPSWGCWNPINTPQPDFHRPEFFGNIVFE